MSYYENRIKALEEKVAEMAKRERMKAIPVEAQLIDSIARLKAEVERLTSERNKALSDFWYIHEGYFRLEAELNRLRSAKDGKPSA